MSLLEAIVLGIVQGLTEFLPISSTAHLRITPELAGWPDPRAAFSAVIQVGTLVAVLSYFRRDVFSIGQAWLRESARGQFATTHEGKLGWMMILGTIPIVVAALLLKKYIDGDFRRLTVIGYAQFVFALLLLAAERYHLHRERQGRGARDLESSTWSDAIWVGLAQCLAIIPGASRSGVTITGSLFCGMDRAAAARFSFLLSLPAVFVAAVYEMYKERHDLLASADKVTALVVATVVSAIVGYAAIAILIRFLRTHATYVFIVYRLALGVFLIAMVSRHVLPDLPPASESTALAPAAPSK